MRWIPVIDVAHSIGRDNVHPNGEEPSEARFSESAKGFVSKMERKPKGAAALNINEAIELAFFVFVILESYQIQVLSRLIA